MTSLRNLLILVVLISGAALDYLSYDSTAQLEQRTMPLTEEVVKGKQVWQDNNCINCHTILGNGAYFAPDLTMIAVKRDQEWLTTFFKDPGEVWPGTVMSKIRLNGEDAENLTAFLTWVKDIDTNGWPPEPPGGENPGQPKGGSEPAGKVIFASKCSMCHQFNGSGGIAGPDLTNIGRERSREWLKSFLRDPQEIKPDSVMGNPGLDSEEIDAITEYLTS